MTHGQPAVVAAGALCWRIVRGAPEVLVIHRPRHRDLSLPKGKAEPGELLPVTAVREVAEETGLGIALGAPLGTVEYTIPAGRDKIVHYWAAEVDARAKHRFHRNDEVDEVDWVPLDAAADRLSYEHDRSVVERFQLLWATGRARTFAMLSVRHGKAVPRDGWPGTDADRPLQKRGVAQADALAPAVTAFGTAKYISSTALRCVSTLAPAAKRAGHHLERTDDISQRAYEAGHDDVRGVVAKRLDRRVSAALCSHGPVLPELLREIARQSSSPVDAPIRHAGMLRTGAFSVVHLAAEDPSRGVVAVEAHGPAA